MTVLLEDPRRWEVRETAFGQWVAVDPDCPGPGLGTGDLCGGSVCCECYLFFDQQQAWEYIAEAQGYDDLDATARGDLG